MATKYDPFQIALKEVDFIATKYAEGELKENAKLLGVRLRLLRSFCWCGKMWGRGERCGSTLLSIEETVYQHALKIQSTGIKFGLRDILHGLVSKLFGGIHQFICLRFRGLDGDDDDEMIQDTVTILDHLRNWRSKLIGCIHHFLCLGLSNHTTKLQHLHSEFLYYIQQLSFSQETEELYRIFLDSSLQTISTSQEFLSLLDFIDSLLNTTLSLQEMNQTSVYVERIQISLRYLKNLVIFANLQGLRPRQMESLVNHTQLSVVDAVRNLSMLFYNQNPQHIDLLTRQGLPLNSPAFRIYVGVLRASKLSLPYLHLTPTECRVIFTEFVDSLLSMLWILLVPDDSSTDMFYHQMQKLYGRLTFLRTTMIEQPNKFDELHEKMSGLIGLAICEAGITINYLIVKGIGSYTYSVKLKILFSKTETYFMKLMEVATVEDMQLMLAANFPQTNLLGFIDRLLENMKSIKCHADSTFSLSKDELQILQDNLTDVRSSLARMRFNQNRKFQDLRSRIAAAVYETEFVLDSFMVGGDSDSFVNVINSIIAAVKLINAEASDTFHSQKQISEVDETSHRMQSGREIPVLDDNIVGLNDAVEQIINRLTRGTHHLDIVSIVGMPGLGKTMLAKKVFQDLSITLYFDFRSWCTISQVYNKINLLIEILSGLGISFDDKCSDMDENDLADKLYKILKGKRYLIILDDVWDTTAWNSLSSSFPNDVNGSRILLTSRQHNVASDIKPNSDPYHLRFLHNDESWKLMQKSLGFKEGYSPEQLACVDAILQNCSGLPLMILVVAGILSNMEPNTWAEVRESLKKGTLSLTEKCMETIELSYSYLPDHLKECFLYFGVIGVSQHIPVRKLLWLWMAEGYIQENGRECSEDLAKGYMRELIQRNLVMVGKEGSRKGTMKYCVVHDMLHDFCMAKGSEEHFLHHLRGFECSNHVEPSIFYRLRLCYLMQEEFEESRLICPRLRTLFIVDDNDVLSSRRSYGILYKFNQSKLLRVLDLRTVYADSSFPVIESLVHLRYLALQVRRGFFLPPSFANLSNLESFIILTISGIALPDTLWNMQNLKHLCVTGLISQLAYWILPNNYLDRSNLGNLNTLSSVLFSSDLSTMEVLRKFPNLRRLRYRCVNDILSGVVALDFMSRLESLTISDHHRVGDLYFQFPQSLKKLTLADLDLPWSKISICHRLPNLEVLKLRNNAFTGELWEMEEGTFPKLRFLKLEDLDLVRWTDLNDDGFPRLENIVLISCRNLEELPSCLAQSSILQTIEVINCKHVAASIKQIQEELMAVGNEDISIQMPSSDERERRLYPGRLFRNVYNIIDRFPNMEASNTVVHKMEKEKESSSPSST